MYSIYFSSIIDKSDFFSPDRSHVDWQMSNMAVIGSLITHSLTHSFQVELYRSCVKGIAEACNKGEANRLVILQVPIDHMLLSVTKYGSCICMWIYILIKEPVYCYNLPDIDNICTLRALETGRKASLWWVFLSCVPTSAN